MFGTVGCEQITLEELAARRRELDAAEAEWLAMVAAYDRSGRAQLDGHENAAAALRVQCRMSGGTARSHVELARKLQQLLETADAFSAGDISRAHARVIADAYTPERAAAITELEPIFVSTAKRVQPRELMGIVRHATDALDGDGGAAADAAKFALRRLHISSTIGEIGIIDGRGDPEGTEIIATAISAEMERDRHANETRRPAQRRYDALVNVCRRALDHAEVGGSRRARPHLTVVVDLERLNGTAELVSDACIEAAHVGRLSRNTLERISCDCTVSRVITRGKSEIIDVGRATRTIPAPLWRALVARDRHCTHPGCDKPPGWCQAHHKIPWPRGGPTDLANLQLLCWHHHHRIHSHEP